MNTGKGTASESYRYGFNGYEKDDEVSGSGNHISFNDYGYDPRTATRWRPDPLMKKYPFLSPYAPFTRNPILFIDVDGEDIYVKNSKDAFKVQAALEKITAGEVKVIVADNYTTGKGYRITVEPKKILL